MMTINRRLKRKKKFILQKHGRHAQIVVMILVMLINSPGFYFMKEFLKLLKILLWIFLLLGT